MKISRKKQKIVTKELASLRDSKGRIRPEQVVNAAKKKTNPLHTFFQWDDGKAANAYRLEQARQLIRSVKVEVTTTEYVFSHVAYVRDPDADGGQGYIETARLRDHRQQAREVLREELKRARAALARAREIASAVDLTEELESLIAELDGFAVRLSEAA